MVVSTIRKGQKIHPHWAAYGKEFPDITGIYRIYITPNPNGKPEIEVSLIADLKPEVDAAHPIMLIKLHKN